MTLYTCLENVPLPEKIYNGPLDKRIIPLVRAITAQGLTTTGSCEGHINQGTPYPWVQFLPYNNPLLLGFLVQKYNEIGRDSWDVDWCLEENNIRTKKEAKNQRELLRMQGSIDSLSQFLFQYRLDALDSSYSSNVVRIPNSNDPEWQRINIKINRLYDDLLRQCNEREAFSSVSSKETYRTKLKELRELQEKESTMGEILEFPITEEQANRWIQRARELLG